MTEDHRVMICAATFILTERQETTVPASVAPTGAAVMNTTRCAGWQGDRASIVVERARSITSAFNISIRVLAVWTFKTSFAIRVRRKDNSLPVAFDPPAKVPASRRLCVLRDPMSVADVDHHEPIRALPKRMHRSGNFARKPG